MAKYLTQLNGVISEVVTNQTSAGAGDAGKIPALDSTGKLDMSMMPVGLGAETDAIEASENLAAGDMVNMWSSTGIKVRKADASSNKPAHGFVLAAVTSGANATVYRVSQLNNQLTGMTIGAIQFLSTTAGGRQETAPSVASQIVQVLGIAKSATEMIFAPQPPITLA